MPAILLLLADPAVLLAGIFLIALALASSAATRPHQENPGITSAFTWATDLVGNLWHRIVRSTVSHFAAAHLAPVVRWLSGLNQLAIGVASTLHAESTAVANAFERLTGHTIPHAVNSKVLPVKKQAAQAHTAATKAHAAASSTSAALTHYKVQTNKRVAHATVAVDVTLPRSIGGIRTRVGTVEHDVAGLRGRTKALEDGAAQTWRWIRTHPLSSVTAAMGAAVAVALSRIGFGFFRCRSWQDFGRTLKCSDANILRDLFALATGLLAASVSLEDFIRAAQAVEGEAVDAIHLFIRE